MGGDRSAHDHQIIYHGHARTDEVTCHSNTRDGYLSQQYEGWLPVTAIRGIVACHNNMLQILYCQAHFSVQETY